MTRQYNAIVRLNPVIKRELSDELKECFDYTVAHNEITENNPQRLNWIFRVYQENKNESIIKRLNELLDDFVDEPSYIQYIMLKEFMNLKPPRYLEEGSNITRHIFSNFPIKKIPEIKKQHQFLLKTSKNYEFQYNFKVKENGEIALNSSLLNEIGIMEHYDHPTILGVVLDYRHMLAGLLMEDYRKGAEWKPTGFRNRQTAIFESRYGKVKERLFDAKHHMFSHEYVMTEKGQKYLNPEARIELR